MTFTSRHWPEGAAFLERACAGAQAFCATHHPEASGGAVHAHRTEHGSFFHTQSLGDRVYSAHQRVANAAFIQAFDADAPAFLQPTLSSLKAHRAAPALRLWIPPTRLGMLANGKLLVLRDGRYAHTDLGESEDYASFSLPSFSVHAQTLLNAIDTLQDHAPEPNAPWWQASRACYYQDTTILLGTLFQANSQDDALIVAPILAWDWTNTDTITISSCSPPA